MRSTAAWLLAATALVAGGASAGTSSTTEAAPPCCSAATDATGAARHQMIETIRNHAGLGVPAVTERVLDAMAKVPRHEFVPSSQREAAYADRPLPIGEGQTISQPYIVALMTDLADVQRGEKVLEIGTGSGYQAAVLAALGARVFTIEIVESLGKTAAEVLRRLDYRGVETRIGDGYKGWPEQAPFDAIVVTAAPDEIPQPLVDQLAVGGRMVVPVGASPAAQSLKVLEKLADGTTKPREILPVRFVPLTRDREP